LRALRRCNGAHTFRQRSQPAVASRAQPHRRLPRAAERLTKDTPAWYAGTRARLEARAALEQAEELRRMLEEVGERSRQ
jgi:hypothetical protein